MTAAERTVARIAQNQTLSEKIADAKDQRPPFDPLTITAERLQLSGRNSEP